MKLILPNSIIKILSTLNSNNYKAYLVGGCVRDMLLGFAPLDYDIATDATCNIIVSIFKEAYRYLETGARYGTITLILDDMKVEVTTFRTESEYLDNRHPNIIKFVENIELDLARRDFTINALAYNDYEGIIDLFNGIDDIKNKVMRCIGEPTVRFTEDALRILRLFRFASKLNFTIDPNSLSGAYACRHLLANISTYRKNEEFFKIITTNPEYTKILEEEQILNYLLPNASTTNINFTSTNLAVNLALLLQSYSSIKQLQLDLASIKYPQSLIKEITVILNYRCPNFSLTNKVELKKLLNKIKINNFNNIIEYWHSLNYDTAELERVLNEIITNNECYEANCLNIKGRDLLELSLKGKEIERMLVHLLELVIVDNSLNEKNKLIDLARLKIQNKQS